jgi:hypothetical protein
MSKTIKEWFESIEDPEIRNKALANMDEKERDRVVYSFKEAIRNGFDWQPTPEGYEYWDKISQGGLNDFKQPPSPYLVNPDHCMNAIKMADTPKQHAYDLKIYNGRVKVYVDGFVMFTFNQIDFLGYYFFKDDTCIFGCTLHFIREKSGASEMDIYFKSKETWLAVNKLLDNNL